MLVTAILLASTRPAISQHYALPPPPSSQGTEPLANGFPAPLPEGYGVPNGTGYMTEGIPVPTEPLWSPSTWIQPVEWDRGIELGLNTSDGNSDAFSLRAGANMKRKTDFNEVGFDLSYAKATAEGIETQHNALLNATYSQNLFGSRWTLFDKLGLEYDEFRAFDLRFWLNAGLGFQVIESDPLSWKIRFGAGASREFGGPSDEWVPEAVFGTDYEHQLDERQKLTATVDYFPAWEDFADYRLVAVVSWEVLLDVEHDLSLKLSINDRYDSTPNGLQPNDVNYALLLLWKL